MNAPRRRSDRRGRRRTVLLACAGGALAAIVVLLVLAGGSQRPAPRSPGTPAQPPVPSIPAVPAGAPSQPAVTRVRIGVSVNGLFNAPGTSAAQIEAQLGALQATAATVARSDALWEYGEPAAPVGGVHHYDWRFDDRIVAALAVHRLRWLPILDYTAGWARLSPDLLHSPPRDPRDFAAFAGALGARYGTGGDYWRSHPELPRLPVDTYEVWNEEDSGVFWSPQPDLAAYARLYAAARNALIAVDSGARVIVGGLTSPKTSMPALLSIRPQLRGHLDGIAIHPYASTPLGVLAHVRDARATLSSLGLTGVQLYLTELGWTVHPPGSQHFVPEPRRPGYIMQSLSALGHTDCGIAAVILYTWVTAERNRADPEDWFGIHPVTGAASPDTEAFTSGVRQASERAPAVALCQ